MESPCFSLLSSLRGELRSEDFIPPHYKESYRLAIDCLVKSGRESYQEFLKGERIGSFLSEEELRFVTEHAEHLPPQNHEEESNGATDNQSSSGTYWPMCSDVDTPALDLGWPGVMQDTLQTNIDVLFHPPRQNNPTIKEVVRKNIQDARQVIAIVMDMFTDVDIFKEVVDASKRGVPVYILLDSFHLKGFLTMAENQGVKIQQMRNMRVRTVKGPTYLCRSGAKFHGAMQQKFLLVDCHTAIYGSYSFAWSFEKIHLSMVQVITGHLVKTYDEEFRIIYARSTMPAQLSPPEGLFERNGTNGQQMVPKFHSAQKIDWRNNLRRTLDTVDRRNCERQCMRDFEESLFDEEANKLRLLINKGIGVHGQMPQLHPIQSTDFLKRHSYAGERKDGHVPPDCRPRASNWNISRETGHVTHNYSMDKHSQAPLNNRGHILHQAYYGHDKHVPSMQQNMPSMENEAKSYMRTLRIETFLQNPDIPFRDSYDYLDQCEPLDKVSSFMQGRMRASLVLRSTIPEQMEVNSHNINSSTGVGPSAAPHTALHYSSMQWNPAAAGDNRMNYEEFLIKRKSLQMLDDNRNNKSFGAGRSSYQPGYASLGRAKGVHVTTSPDVLTESWLKRHSMVEPKPNPEYAPETSAHMYRARMQVNRSTAGISAQNGGYGSYLNEDQRSVSHGDVKNISVSKSSSTPNWQEPPSRTVSAAALHVDSKDLTAKSNNHHFLKKSSKKIKSLLNIPEKREDSIGTQSLKSSSSVDTITAMDEEGISDGQGEFQERTKTPVRPPSEQQGKQLDNDYLKYSNPRFSGEEHRNPPQISPPKTIAHKKPTVLDRYSRPGLDTGSWGKDRRAESRLHSRHEPFCTLEKKHSMHAALSSQEKAKSLPKSEAAVEHKLTQAARGHHENKLEKFFQRVGSLLHKSK